ncbi:MAG TPA: pseudouridine synthase [Actinomycetes bacterium]|nr:pseudouridine synthase [Actinomycetes bacterium]
MVRLQKVLAQAGVASRRASEELISSGRVSVDGKDVTELGTRVDPQTAVVRVDGERIPTAAGRAYLALNKPSGVLTAMSDDRGRRCVGDLVTKQFAKQGKGLFHVGRLDIETEGLLLLTNDGDLAHRLSHPSFGVQKVYLAEVPGPVPKAVTQRLRQGIELEDGPVVVDRFRVVASSGRKAQVEVTLHEGRNHVVRRLLAAVDLPVQRLVRLAFGPVRLGQLGPGSVRPLSAKEIGRLLEEVDLRTSR